MLEHELPRPPAKGGLAGGPVEEACGCVGALGNWIARGFNSTSIHNTNDNDDNDNDSTTASVLSHFLNPQVAGGQTGDDEITSHEQCTLGETPSSHSWSKGSPRRTPTRMSTLRLRLTLWSG